MKPPPTLRKYRDDNRGDKAEDEDLVKYRGLRGLLSRLLWFVPEAGEGITVTQTQDGPRWTIGAGLDTPLSVSTAGRVTPGTIGGAYPKIGGISIATLPPPTLTIPASGTRHVVVNIAMTLSKDGTTYVSGFTSLDQVTITLETDDPGPAGLKSDDGVFAFKLATFVNRVKTAQPYSGSLTLSVCDDGTATGTADLIIE